jgi:hypothetical protein
MKKLFALVLVTLSFLSFAPAASAQQGINAGCQMISGTPNHWACDPGNQVIVGQTTIVRNVPTSGMAFRPCSNEERIERAGLMTVAGGIVGVLIGDNHRAASRGAGLGLLYGMGSDCRVAMPIQRESVNSSTRVVSAEEQVGGEGGYKQRPRTIHHPADCDIGGHSDMQGLDVSPEKCESLRNAQRVTKPGRCIIGGVSYTELVDNDAGCKAKEKELTVNKPAQTVVAHDPNVPVAYCPIYGPGGEKKHVVNRERRDAYCGEVIRDLQARKISWDNLETVN